MLLPSLRVKEAKVSWTSRAPAESRPSQGPSRTRSSGSERRAAARPSLRFIPTEYSPVGLSASLSVKKTLLRALSTSWSSHPPRYARISRFSFPVKCGKREAPSGRAPTFESGSFPPSPRLFPQRRILPSVGGIKPRIIRITVVLPAPWGPRQAYASPSSTLKSSL